MSYLALSDEDGLLGTCLLPAAGWAYGDESMLMLESFAASQNLTLVVEETELLHPDLICYTPDDVRQWISSTALKGDGW